MLQPCKNSHYWAHTRPQLCKKRLELSENYLIIRWNPFSVMNEFDPYPRRISIMSPSQLVTERGEESPNHNLTRTANYTDFDFTFRIITIINWGQFLNLRPQLFTAVSDLPLVPTQLRHRHADSYRKAKIQPCPSVATAVFLVSLKHHLLFLLPHINRKLHWRSCLDYSRKQAYFQVKI